VVILLATALALAIRLYQVLRPGYLTGITEYDDGVYFGAAVRLVHGAMPYRSFVLVQPPGIVVLMAPLALLAKATGTATGFAVARMITALAGAAAIPLAGWLVRRRGVAACAIACGVLAVFPGGLNAAHTLLLEPWIVVFCLLGAVAVFEDEQLTESPRRLTAGGIAFGVAAAIKLWALLPILAVVLVCLPASRRAALRPFLLGAVGALAVLILPFFLAAPHAFYRDVVVAQVSRVDVTRVAIWKRLAGMTGADAFAPVSRNGALLSAAGCAALIGAGAVVSAVRERRGPAPLEAFALLCTGLILVTFLIPADYYPHYPWFFAPFLALALGLAASRLVSGVPGPWLTAGVALAVAVVVGLAAKDQWAHLAKLRSGRPAALAHRQIPAGACVLTDLQDFTLVSNRFVSTKPGCPTMVDLIGTEYALAHGHNGLTGAGRFPAVQALFLSAFRHADFVWLQCSPGRGHGCLTNRRIPWTHAILAYFRRHFRRAPGHPSLANLYVRRGA
jgi:glycosyl transferase family 87